MVSEFLTDKKNLTTLILNVFRASEKSEYFLSNGVNDRTPDNDVFEDMAKLYAAKHTDMHLVISLFLLNPKLFYN